MIVGHARLALFGGVALLALLGIAALAAPGRAGSEPFTPRSNAQVLEKLPGRARPRTAGTVSLARPSTDPEVAERLARADIQSYQETSDPRYLGHAEARLAAFWNASDAPLGIVVLRAKIRASNHEFEPALADLSHVLSRAPEHVQALFERATISTVLGRHAAAQADCQALQPLASALFTSGCSAIVAGATGHAAAAAAQLGRALDGARGISRAEASWAESLLGELAVRTGDTARAEACFRRALIGAPADAYTLAALADLLLDQDRAREVVSLLQSFTQSDGLLLRLAIAEARLSLPDAESHVAELRERFAAARLRGSEVHLREEARFELVLGENATRALELALANFRIQREAWDLRLLLEAAISAGRPQAAREAAKAARDWGLEDPRIARLVVELNEAAR